MALYYVTLYNCSDIPVNQALLGLLKMQLNGYI